MGKSTLFNRMIQRREAIVDAVSGVTRDRHYGKSDWNGKSFSLIDTGGYVVGSDDIFEAEIDKQVKLAIEEADAIIFWWMSNTASLGWIKRSLICCAKVTSLIFWQLIK